MSSPREKQYYVEITRHTVHALRVASSAVEFYGECPIDQKTTADALIVDWSGGTRLSATVLGLPPSFWHLSTAEEAPRHRTPAAWQALAAQLPHGFTGAPAVAACSAEDGAPVAPDARSPWLLNVAPAESTASLAAPLVERSFACSGLESATAHRVGGIVAALRLENTAPVFLWELGVDRSHFLLVTTRGIEAAIPCTAGFDAIFGAIQSALGLKMRGAAARLFFNDTYDFSEAAARIATEIAPAIKTALSHATTQVPCALACVGLTARQSWLPRAVAQAVGLTPFTPDLAKLIASLRLSVPSTVSLPSEALGLLHAASAHARSSAAWRITWSAVAEKPASAPGSASGGAANAAEPPARPPVFTGATATAESHSPAIALATDAPVAVAVAPEPKVSRKPATTAAKTEAKPVAKTQPVVARKTEAPTAKPPVPPASTSVPAAAPAAPVPPARRRSRGLGMYLGIAAGLAFAGLAAKFYFDAQSAQQVAEQEKAAAAERLKSAEARARELEAQAKSEAERIRREAEAARERAVALARQQAEEQTRRQISADLEAERIAKSPGILIVTTSPAGAQVSIDDGPARTAPLSIDDLLPGAHRVAISLPGYEPIELTAEILGTKTTDLGLIQLERATGTLALDSTPAGAAFAIREANARVALPIREGRTPARLDDMPPGEYVVTFTRPGWRDQNVNIAVAKRALARATAEFKGGAIRLTSTPTGATVIHEGKTLGTTPLTLDELPPGPANYEFMLDGHEPLSLSATIEEGRQIELAATLLHFDRIASSSEMATPPQPIEQPAPETTFDGRNSPSEIKLSFVVWRDGTTRDIQALGNLPPKLAASYVAAVARWKFLPARNREGRPINVRVTLPIKIVADQP